MTYQLRVVPKKKRRGRQNGSGNNALVRQQRDERQAVGSLIPSRPLSDSSYTVLGGLDAISSSATYPRGSVLFVEGQKSAGIFILRSGRVRLSTGSADGKSLIIRIAEPGEVMGLASAITGRANELNAEALAPIECGVISRDSFLQFLRESSSEALRMAEILSDMYAATLKQVRYLGLSASTAEKVARFLLELPASQRGGNGHVQQVPLTHKQIAEMIGSSRETITRTLARFRREKLVQVNCSELRITDRSGLEALLKG